MKVQMQLVDKGSHRYSQIVAKQKPQPNVVLSLEAGRCGHYQFILGEGGVYEKSYCNGDADLTKANGLLCSYHDSVLFPTLKKGNITATWNASDVILHDNKRKQPSDWDLSNPNRQRREVNKRPANHWDLLLDKMAEELKGREFTTEAVRELIAEDLGWDLTDARTVYLLKKFIN